MYLDEKPFSKKYILGTKNEKKMKIYGFHFFFQKHCTKATDIQVLKDTTFHHKISRLGGGGLLQ